MSSKSSSFLRRRKVATVSDETCGVVQVRDGSNEFDILNGDEEFEDLDIQEVSLSSRS